ncbi:Aste57867_22328 [Aphanomyces stellatus]|uniref:Aste57867_22328 protein n=1 Tax=Aphanomyces stellatus TaxID=120398 RepID=A0A485LPR0_9STRA|nr:hypothetical protein As57867_022258 [Aphanomyces stellatus]VFT98991.1 Aste57867_22328 [Aphanomyces stellatus]
MRRFPAHVPLDQDYVHFDAIRCDGSLAFSESLQCVWPCSFDLLRTFLKGYVQDTLFLDPHNLTIEDVSNTRLYQKLTAKAVWINYLQGYFTESDRVVVVFRQIEADKAAKEVTPSVKQAHFMAWLEARPVSPTHAVLRISTQFSPQFRPADDGLFSAEDHAAFWDFDLSGVPEGGDKMEALGRAFVRQAHERVPAWRQAISSILDTMHNKEVNE